MLCISKLYMYVFRQNLESGVKLKWCHLAEYPLGRKNKRFHSAEKKQKVSLGRKNKRFHLAEKNKRVHLAEKTKGFTWPKKQKVSLGRKILSIFVIWLRRFAPFAK